MKISIFQNTKNLKDFALKVFIASLGLPGSFLGPPGDLVSNIIKKEAYRKPKKLPGSYKKFHGRNPETISLVFWEKLIFHKDIIKSTDL